jgi:hypothetical protein
MRRFSGATRANTRPQILLRSHLYVRQSTLRQVVENTESTQRQYALRERATGLGWPIERVQVIDCDQGRSGASAADREGFQRLVAEVSLGHAGIVLGLKVSRLARNNSDRHRLLEICALAGTLILDEDGLYDPSQYNDRLLLGLKGTISEAELHVLRARRRIDRASTGMASPYLLEPCICAKKAMIWPAATSGTPPASPSVTTPPSGLCTAA